MRKDMRLHTRFTDILVKNMDILTSTTNIIFKIKTFTEVSFIFIDTQPQIKLEFWLSFTTMYDWQKHGHLSFHNNIVKYVMQLTEHGNV